MDIVFLSHRVPYPPNKGEKIRTFNQIKYLSEKGHNIVVFSPLENTEDTKHLKELEQHYCKASFSAASPGKGALLKGLLRGQALSVANFYSKALQQQLDHFLATNRMDAIVCTSSSMAEYLFKSGELERLQKNETKLVMDFMDLDSDKWKQYQKLKPFPLSLIYWREAHLIAQYERKIHDVFNAGLFISQAEIDLFLTNTKDQHKLHEIGNGMDTDFFAPATTPKSTTGPVLLFTGVMDYLPNEDAVCWFVDEAWKSVKKKHPQASFIIAGMNPSNRVKQLEQYQGVIVTGFVDDIRQYYDQAHIFIAPFRLARGVQNKVLQAFACALPTITTSMGCEGIDANHGEHVLIANTMDETIQAIDTLIENNTLAESISSNALDLVRKRFSWQGKLAPLEQILSHNGPSI